jgi:hypothetical protein
VAHPAPPAPIEQQQDILERAQDRADGERPLGPLRNIQRPLLGLVQPAQDGLRVVVVIERRGVLGQAWGQAWGRAGGRA